MTRLLETLMIKELSWAKKRNYKQEMLLTSVAVIIFSVFSFTVYNFGWAGFLLAILYFWHRYVVLKVAKFYDASAAECEPTPDAHPSNTKD